MLGATGFLSDFVKDEVKCRGLSVEDFGAEIDNEKNDIPLYDMYNRGLAACEEEWRGKTYNWKESVGFDRIHSLNGGGMENYPQFQSDREPFNGLRLSEFENGK